MVDRTDPVIVSRDAGHGTSAVAWIALIISLLALTLAWMAYNRTGQDLEDRIQESVQQSVQGIESGVQEGTDAIDAGPDGVDEDDTDTGQGTIPNNSDTNTTTP